MNRKTIFGSLTGVAIVCAVATFGLAPEDARASGLSTWAELEAQVVALVPAGPAQNDLVARVQQIEFVYSNGGLDEEVHAAYLDFVDGVGSYVHLGTISTFDGGQLLLDMQQIAANFDWEIEFDYEGWLQGIGASGKKCQNRVCNPNGPWCVAITLKKDGLTVKFCVGG